MRGKPYYKESFPLLTDFYLYDNSESSDYNCISHSISRIHEGSWPDIEGINYWPVEREVSIKSFNLFYEYHGFVASPYLDFSYDPLYEKIALFTKDDIPTHASKQLDDTWWESKIGLRGILKHDLFELEQGLYGDVYKIYKKPRTVSEKRIMKFETFISQRKNR